MTVFNSSSRNKVVKVALGQGGSQIVGKHTLAIYGFRQYRVGYTKWMLKGSSMAPISVNSPKVGYNPEKIDVHISRFKGGIIIMSKTSKYLKKNAAVKDLKRGFVASKDDLDCAILTGGFVAGILKDGQTREHALLAFTIGVRKMICCCNKRSLDMIKGMTPEEIRKTFNIKNDFTPEEEEEVRRENKTFNIKNDFTPEEEEEVRRENQWAFE